MREKKSFMPPQMPGDFERLLWDRVPADLRGKVVSLDELNSLFPKNDSYSAISVIKENSWYKIYGRSCKARYPIRIAYQCKKCNAIIIGMPEMIEEDSIGEMPLCGREGYSLYCKRCNNLLEDITIKAS
jgi:hypothetical protein